MEGFAMKIFTRVLVKDETGSIMVIQDRENVWNFPGGKLELGETGKNGDYNVERLIYL